MLDIRYSVKHSLPGSFPALDGHVTAVNRQGKTYPVQTEGETGRGRMQERQIERSLSATGALLLLLLDRPGGGGGGGGDALCLAAAASGRRLRRRPDRRFLAALLADRAVAAGVFSLQAEEGSRTLDLIDPAVLLARQIQLPQTSSYSPSKPPKPAATPRPGAAVPIWVVLGLPFSFGKESMAGHSALWISEAGTLLQSSLDRKR